MSSSASRPPTNGVTYRAGHSTVSDVASDSSLKRNGAPTAGDDAVGAAAGEVEAPAPSRARRKLRSAKSTASRPVGGNRPAPLGAAKTDW